MITIQQIFSNLSSYQAAVPVKQIYLQLDKFYDSIKSKIQITKAEFDDTGTTVYIKLPATNVKAFYDIVLWVDTQTKIKLPNNLKVYSNSPNFGYTFAYLYNKQKSLLFPEYYPIRILNEQPKIKNPLKVISFDKHTYSALKHIFKANLPFLVNNTKAIKPIIKNFIDKEQELLAFRKK